MSGDLGAGRRLVVLGAGFAGFWAAMAARRIGGTATEVTMVAPEPSLVLRPRLYEAAPEKLAVPLEPVLDRVGVTFRAGVGTGMDLGDPTGAGLLHLAGGGAVPFDRLVVATGSVMAPPRVPGAEHAHSIDTQREAIAFDRALAEVARRSTAPAVVVVGAGFTGIELALELRDRLGAHGGSGVAEAARVVLVDRSDSVGSELGAGPRPVIGDALLAARVELCLGAAIAAIRGDGVELAGGRAVRGDLVVLATGLRAAPFTASVPGERDRLGRILTDATLRAPAAPSVFVAGDAAAADTGDGHLALQSCQHALRLGRVAGHNAAADLVGAPLVAYRQPRYVTCLDLGRSGAVFTVGWEREVTKVGEQAKAIKRRINGETIVPPLDASAEELLAAAAPEL